MYGKCRAHFDTFVDVSAVVAVGRDDVPCGAFADERADGVAAPPVPAQEGHHAALVHVLAVLVGAEFEPGVAVALVSADQIDAGAVVANVRMSRALVDIDAGVSRGRQEVPRVADALEAALEILADPVLADVGSIETLVYVHAIQERIAVLVAFRAPAFEAAGEVDAFSVAFARARDPFAFVVVVALVGVRVVDVAAVALALETAGSVQAYAVRAESGHHRAFVDFFC